MSTTTDLQKYNDIVQRLTTFGFSKTDALVYLDVLKNGRTNGYQIAKSLGMTRSTIYSSIDNLYLQGYLYMISSSVKEYEAKSPDVILAQIREKTIDDITVLKKELAVLSKSEEKPFFFNLSGYESLILKIKELINDSKNELYINTDFDITLFQRELQEAIIRGVRVICFSFNQMHSPIEGIEFFSRSHIPEHDFPSTRFMLVRDTLETLVFSNLTTAQGIYTNEKILVKIISEHIHSDIYLSGLFGDKPLDLVNIAINTNHERQAL
ncbi:TrmB family transcriptional regulator [Endozoicomonas acroporae]|uniref:TrmB family transcriptional regulator n=1 Tax=Endozoicomonas acroporae TaxID=1701104 RepID=UPI0013D5146A|nr:helix-turn-helix domain-containing protein [Endozoicomonas acroporae]